jgi:hypothetical protein
MDRTACLLAGALLTLSATATVSAEPPVAEPVLRRWAAASAAIPPPGKSAGQRALFAHRRQHSGHEIALILKFRGPVDVADLLQRYQFARCNRNGDRIRLRATPKDGVERLFFEQFELTLDAKTYLPTAISFTDRHGNRKGELITLFTDRQRERFARTNEPVEAPVPRPVKLASADDPAENSIVQAAFVRFSKARMPSLIDLHWKQAKKTLEKLGYAVKFRRGRAAQLPEQVFYVYDQVPKPDELLTPKTTVILTLFDNVEESSTPKN